MNKIWVVENFDGESADVIAAYSNEEAANKHVEQLQRHSHASNEYAVYSWNVADEAPVIHWTFAISDYSTMLGGEPVVYAAYSREGGDPPVLRWDTLKPVHNDGVDFAGGFYVEGPDGESVKAKYDELHAAG